MTSEEAATILYKEWQRFLENNLDYAGISDAYTMAIKALKQEPCEDSISRQAVLDLVVVNHTELNGVNVVMYSPLCKDIKQLPSVTPHYTNAEIQKMQEMEQAEIQKAYGCGKHANRWISVSERLPEIHQDVLLSLRSLDVVIGFRATTEPYFYCKGMGSCYIEPQNVLAWQPLPESYKAESEE